MTTQDPSLRPARTLPTVDYTALAPTRSAADTVTAAETALIESLATEDMAYEVTAALPAFQRQALAVLHTARTDRHAAGLTEEQITTFIASRCANEATVLLNNARLRRDQARHVAGTTWQAHTKRLAPRRVLTNSHDRQGA